MKGLSEKVVLEFCDETLGTVVFRYPFMGDASGMRDYKNSLVDEKAEIGRQERVNLEEVIDSLSDHIKEIKKENRIGLVVEIGGEIMGHGKITKKRQASSHVGKLSIGLREEARGHGVGSKLMESLISEARKELDIELVTLGVFDTNEKARNLYRNYGFEEIGRLEDGIKQDKRYKDLIRMKKDLRS